MVKHPDSMKTMQTLLNLAIWIEIIYRLLIKFPKGTALVFFSLKGKTIIVISNLSTKTEGRHVIILEGVRMMQLNRFFLLNTHATV